MGEFNLHQLQNNHRVLTKEFIERLFSHGFLPHNESKSTDFPFYNINWQQSYLRIIFQHMSSPVLFSIVNNLSDDLPIYALFYDEALPH